jgi:hypothetical protein
MRKVKTFTVRFKNELKQPDIPLFRGAVINMLQRNNILFHNHTEEGLRYTYPFIQYKRINNRAAIVCVEEGTESIGEFFSSFKDTVYIGRKESHLELDSVKAEQVLVQAWSDLFTYSIRKWLPFNSENYEKYQQTAGLKEKIDFMERILTGNILSFAKGVNIHFEEELVCTILDITPKGPMHYKGIHFESFDALFKINVSLPNYIGLGKGVSHGFGTIVRMNDNNSHI